MRLLQRASIRELKSEKRYWERFFLEFSSFLYQQKGYYDQFTGSVFKIIKVFFNYLLIEKALPVGQFHKRFRIPAEKFNPVVLSPGQLHFLISNTEFYSGLSNSLKRARDIFVFGCTTGLRYSDLMLIRKSNIMQDDNGFSIQFTTGKTGSQIRIPLPEYILEIIKKYKNKTGKFLLPRLSNVNLNRQIKILAEKAGWTYPLPKMRHRQGRIVEIKTMEGKTLRFCDHMTTHTMRRTAITTLLMMGVPEIMVKRISGHAPGSREFYRYVDIVQDYLDKNVRIAHHRLMNLGDEK